MTAVKQWDPYGETRGHANVFPAPPAPATCFERQAICAGAREVK